MSLNHLKLLWHSAGGLLSSIQRDGGEQSGVLALSLQTSLVQMLREDLDIQYGCQAACASMAKRSLSCHVAMTQS